MGVGLLGASAGMGVGCAGDREKGVAIDNGLRDLICFDRGASEVHPCSCIYISSRWLEYLLG